jgi:hypothetical protein
MTGMINANSTRAFPLSILIRPRKGRMERRTVQLQNCEVRMVTPPTPVLKVRNWYWLQPSNLYRRSIHFRSRLENLR